jgi:phosphoribosylformylglycinamidine cyclo-ligase
VPSVIYAPAMQSLMQRVDVHAFAHVTGGGLPGNLARVIPDHCDAVVQRGTWEEPRIFVEIQEAGDVARDEMEHVFNMGIGMVAVVPHGDAFSAVDHVRSQGHDAWRIGEILDGQRRVVLSDAS